ncbi:hypothetical protein OPV22_010980 [Ensete ventricosum]|uniref:Plastocyanin-like domain-containing protein n=1 Tax=Ensete ventricosum TaxID=4639 RepID=A0AAV8RMF9_ENSVE|nr:hypothetical protein OPV22_010980 [Ensete ventricosum]
MTDEPAASEAPIKIALNVVNATYRTFIEIVFENPERSMRACHLDGYSFFPAGMGQGKWTPESRKSYNLADALYISMLSPERSLRDEYNTPDNALLCGGVAKLPRPPSDV